MKIYSNGMHEAITNLAGGQPFGLESHTYDGLIWLGDESTKPSKEAVENEMQQLLLQHNATQYQRDREAEYPPITDYLDGVVKGDQAQVDAYIAACQAVKDKYPKP